MTHSKTRAMVHFVFGRLPALPAYRDVPFRQHRPGAADRIPQRQACYTNNPSRIITLYIPDSYIAIPVTRLMRIFSTLTCASPWTTPRVVNRRWVVDAAWPTHSPTQRLRPWAVRCYPYPRSAMRRVKGVAVRQKDATSTIRSSYCSDLVHHCL